MTSSIRQEFGNEIANVVLDEIQYRRSRYYYFLGGIGTPWISNVKQITVTNQGSGYTSTPTVSISPPSDTGGTQATATAVLSSGKVVQINVTNPGSGYTDPPEVFISGGNPTTAATAVSSVYIPETYENNRRIRSEILFAKKIVPSEVSLAIHRVDWTSNTVYDQWDHTVDMTDKEFYVITDEYKVYKCLDNYNGSESTVKPTGNSLYPIKLADGYIWKYMYTVPAFKRVKFLSPSYMPVQKALSDSFYNNGSIESVDILNSGSGYTDTQLTQISFSGGTTTGSGALGTPVISTNGVYSITGVTITNAGTGYTKGANVVFSGVGSGAEGRAIIGKINTIALSAPNNGGSGYTSAPQVVIGQPNDPNGVQATATATISGGAVNTITITNYGSGYTTAPTVSFTGGSPTLVATATATVYADRIGSVYMINGGAGYTGTPSVSFTVGGATAVPILSRTTATTGYVGSIIDTLITNRGYGYLTAPTITVTVSAGQTPGTGAYGNATAVLGAVVYDGRLQRITISDPGKNYPYSTSTAITVSGNGTGAAFTPVVNGGKIVDVIVENGGSGYTDATLSVTGTGTGASLLPVIAESDFSTDQYIIEQAAVKGAIYNIQVSNQGSGYSDVAYAPGGSPIPGTGTTVTIIGDGTGCTAYPVIQSGAITKIIITNPGSGYTYANVVIDDLQRDDSLLNSTQKARAYAILPPADGHGYDAPIELAADVVAINSDLRSDLASSGISQDFRIYGILKNPRSLLTGFSFNKASTVCTYKMQVTSTTGMVLDEVLKFGTNLYRVVNFLGTTVHLVPLSTDTLVPIGLLTSLDNTRQYTATNVINYLELNKYSGHMIYASTENAFTFSEAQSIAIKTFLKF